MDAFIAGLMVLMTVGAWVEARWLGRPKKSR